ncbi:disulfide bond formation protein B [Anianabacter salinae]|uniref:disulfide bond formation protein B n=1 Tax=Anianabacter salinae TaxID=2851023 RepID=UPI00225E5832|nr:disulfide bond formation protein B [Anianabacter salinae]MBV0912053.1 disulfide bond formation protein B [Anianabacter salinae]
MTRRGLIALAASGSAALLLGALAFQYWGGLAPCKLCIWQRWPHGAAILIGLVGLILPLRWIAGLGALAALSTAGVGLYHVGVEQGWWEGPTTCTSGSVTGLSTQDLMAQIMTAPLVRCDDIAWSMAGISMAGWNAILSLGLAAIWIAAALRQVSSK